MKATNRKLAIGKDRIYALENEPGNITHNLGEAIKVAERFSSRVYASDIRPAQTTESTSLTCDVPLVIHKEVEKAFEGMKIGKAQGDDGITVDLWKEGENIAQEKLAVLFSEYLKAQKVPIALNTPILFGFIKKETLRTSRITDPSPIFSLQAVYQSNS